MQANNHQIVDCGLVLDAKFGKEGSSERLKHGSQGILYSPNTSFRHVRKPKLHKANLPACRHNPVLYLKKESGAVELGAGLFFRLVHALGLRIGITGPIGFNAEAGQQ